MTEFITHLRPPSGVTTADTEAMVEEAEVVQEKLKLVQEEYTIILEEVYVVPVLSWVPVGWRIVVLGNHLYFNLLMGF